MPCLSFDTGSKTYYITNPEKEIEDCKYRETLDRTTWKCKYSLYPGEEEKFPYEQIHKVQIEVYWQNLFAVLSSQWRQLEYICRQNGHRNNKQQPIKNFIILIQFCTSKVQYDIHILLFCQKTAMANFFKICSHRFCSKHSCIIQCGELVFGFSGGSNYTSKRQIKAHIKYNYQCKPTFFKISTRVYNIKIFKNFLF